MAIKRRVWAGAKMPMAGVMAAGYVNEGAYILEMIESHQPGTGNVGRYLGELMERYHTVIVMACISPRLAGMLERRGFVEGNASNYIWRCPLAPCLLPSVNVETQP